MSKIEDINRAYYDGLYRKRNLLAQLIYPFISYDQQCKSKYNIRLIKKVIRETKKENFHFMDYGFGHGSLILKMPQKEHLYGCDISDQAVTNFPRVARIVGKNVVTFLPDQLDERLRNVKLDMISLSHVIEHVDDDQGLLRGLSNRMNANGKFLINVPINEVWEDPKHVRKYSVAYMEDLARRSNLRIDDWQEVEKWSGFFLELEKVKKVGKIGMFFVKATRLLFALLPLSIITALEKLFLPSKYINRQLVVLLSRK
jgi:SAM-dependent methyltransferase